jgi:hypothetical protein
MTMHDKSCDILSDKFQTRLDALSPEQAQAAAQAVQQGATLSSTYWPHIATIGCTANWPDGNRLAVFSDTMSKLEIELVGDLFVAILNEKNLGERERYGALIEAGARMELVLVHGDVAAAVWLRAGDRSMLVSLLGDEPTSH